MKNGLVILALVAVAVAVGLPAIRAAVDSGNVELQAARAETARQEAAQEAVKTWQAQREAELSVQVAAERAQNAIAFDGAWAGLALAVGLGLGGAAVVLAVGLAFAAVDAARLRALEDENRRLKRLLAESMLDVSALKDLLGKP